MADVDDRLERLERDRGLQCPQVARGEPLEVLAQPDHGQRVERLGLEARVNHHDPGTGLEQVVGDRLDQGQADPFGDRRLRSARPRSRPSPPCGSPRAGAARRWRPGSRSRCWPSTRTTSHSMGPSARISTPTAPSRRAASHASDRNGKGAVALDTTLGVTACGLDRGVYRRDERRRDQRADGRADEDQWPKRGTTGWFSLVLQRLTTGTMPYHSGEQIAVLQATSQRNRRAWIDTALEQSAPMSSEAPRCPADVVRARE